MFHSEKNYVIPPRAPLVGASNCTRRLWVRFRSRPLWDSPPASGASPARPEPPSSMPLLGLRVKHIGTQINLTTRDPLTLRLSVIERLYFHLPTWPLRTHRVLRAGGSFLPLFPSDTEMTTTLKSHSRHSPWPCRSPESVLVYRLWDTALRCIYHPRCVNLVNF